jgi:hypothetical protein
LMAMGVVDPVLSRLSASLFPAPDR